MISASRLLISVWFDAALVNRPGGMCGATTKPTSRSATIASTTQMTPARIRWERSSTGSDDLEEAVHPADRLHRPAEPVDPAGGAGHEALPAVKARLAGLELEDDRVVRLRHGAGRDRTLVGSVVGHALERDAHSHVGDREGMGGVVGVEDVERLPVHRHRAADDPARLAQERVAQPAVT